MSTVSITTQAPEIAMIQANCRPMDGWQIHWLISRKQIEYLLTDIVSLPPSVEQPHLERAQYLEQSLPVIHLENHFGLVQDSPPASFRYLVSKCVTRDKKIMRAMLKICHPVRMRKLSFHSTPTIHSTIPSNEHHILGAFTMPDNQLVIIPDIFAIVDTLGDSTAQL